MLVFIVFYLLLHIWRRSTFFLVCRARIKKGKNVRNWWKSIKDYKYCGVSDIFVLCVPDTCYANILMYFPFNPQPAGGGRICPLPDFLNNSKTVADIDTKLGVPYPTSMWHRMTKFGRNRSENFWEIDVFVGSLHTNFEQNRLNVKKFAKIEF